MANIADQVTSIPAFTSKVADKRLLWTKESLETMQINVGCLCNLSCRHCHVEAGPQRTEVMSEETMAACLQVFQENGFKNLDITGGAPEMNPHLAWLIREASPLGKLMVRTNLVILKEPPYERFMDIYKENKVEIICSLPYYSKKTAEKQRGTNTFESSIRVLKRLNDIGYGREKDLVLNMVFNPAGAFLPPPQGEIEREYKRRLKDQYDIDFNQLFAITNNPVGRFAEFLEQGGNLEGYLVRLSDSYNPATVANMMCRSQLSVRWDGKLYDCDFNQTLDLALDTPRQIGDLKGKAIETRAIKLGNHCYACTAGAGSSCGGNTA